MALPKTMTLSEFVVWESRQDEKHEYYRGKVYVHPQRVAMPGGTARHNEIEVNLIVAVGTAFEDSPFRPYTSNQMVVTEEGDAAFYPDVVLLEGPRDALKYGTSNAAANPAVVFEIASSGTERYDRGQKLSVYKAMPTMREVILVQSSEAKIERFVRHRDAWHHEDYEGLDAILPILNVEIPLRRIYKNVDVPPFSLGLATESDESSSAT